MNIARKSENRGRTRALILWGIALAAAVLLIGILASQFGAWREDRGVQYQIGSPRPAGDLGTPSGAVVPGEGGPPGTPRVPHRPQPPTQQGPPSSVPPLGPGGTVAGTSE